MWRGLLNSGIDCFSKHSSFIQYIVHINSIYFANNGIIDNTHFEVTLTCTFQNMPLILIMTQNAAYLWPECIAVRALITYFNGFMLGDFRKVAICVQ